MGRFLISCPPFLITHGPFPDTAEVEERGPSPELVGLCRDVCKVIVVAQPV